MFRDREDAALQLAKLFEGKELDNPLVLAIPRGGLVTGVILAQALDAELDVVLSRKLRCPGHPELALGAISESGDVHLNPSADDILAARQGYLAEERKHQLEEIAQRQCIFREVRTAAPIAGRSVIVTDDGAATGSTILAAMQTVRSQNPKELIVAVPVAPADTIRELKKWADQVVCVLAVEHFYAVGQFYTDFEPVEDEEAVRLLRRGMAQQAGGHRTAG